MLGGLKEGNRRPHLSSGCNQDRLQNSNGDSSSSSSSSNRPSNKFQQALLSPTAHTIYKLKLTIINVFHQRRRRR